jgi:hypothetical protein
MGIRKQITILILHCVISRLVHPLKIIYFSVQISDVLVLTAHCKLINFVFQILPSLFSEISAGFAIYIVHIIPIYFT